MTDEELNKVAEQVYQKLESKFHALDGVVGARGAKGDDGKQGERGLPGRDAVDGKEGKAGLSTRLVVVYKLTDTDQSPGNPTGGTWDYESNVVTPPADWSESAPNHESGYLWSSQAVFSSNGQQLQAWTQPIRLNGKDGGDGEDASDIEYVYKLTKNKDEIPSVPANDVHTDDFTGDWSDNPHGITEEMKAEWMCSRLKQTDGTWGNWIGPTLWSVWGSTGKDGDGVQYVYKQTKDKNPPNDITEVDNEQLNEFIPTGWFDDPQGVSEEMPFEWVSKRKFDGINQVWGDWSKPKLWASFGMKGDTGLSAKFMYQDCIKGVDAPVIEDRKKPNPGKQWQELVPYPLEPQHVIWACQALIDGDGKVWCDETQAEDKQGWQGPWIITGADGEQGEVGPEPDYVVIVFQQSELKPEKPTSNDPKNPGGNWSNTAPVDTTNGNWWGCWGNVQHVDNPEYEAKKAAAKKEEDVIEKQIKTINWGDPLPLNGNMGNPCILASFQVTNINGTKSGTITSTNGSTNIGVQSVSYAMSGPKLEVTVTAKAGYTVKITSANCNIGTTKWATCKETKRTGQRSGGSMHAAHVLIENSSTNKIYCQSWAQGNKDNDTSYNYEWGDWQTSFNMTIFGTVTRNIVKGSV